jgi:hypothetical protein
MENRFLKNARIVLEVSCLAKAGESVLILTDSNERRLACARALEAAAVELGVIPVIMDVSAYSRLMAGKPRHGPLGVKPIKVAVESADIVIRAGGPDFTILVGDPDIHDKFLTAQQRRMHLQTKNMETWEITPEDVAAIRRRTMWLLERLRSVKQVRVTSPAGTDFSFGLGPPAKWLPILGIVPLYGEVAITPQQGSESGVYVVDGPTQRGVRPVAETDRTPLRIEVKAGRIQDMSGDAEQIGRLKTFIANGNPPFAVIDEVGIVTTRIEANDAYWGDGTHRHDTLHIALGNNLKRDTMVHGQLHMDGEVLYPTVRLDGQVIVENGVFLDRVMKS